MITISWHLNPLSGKTTWNPEPGTVASILPGGSKHDLYKTWLDKIAAFIKGLKGSRGEYIPVIFRPYHELKGTWFWWGSKNCIYGLAQYYEASGERISLHLAKDLFQKVEQYSFDKTKGGYPEAFTQRWKLTDDLRLVRKTTMR